MDIWSWVHGRYEALIEDDHEELAEYLYSISSYAVDEKFDLVDQTFNAAMPLVKSLDDKWLEIYFRHWRLQAHVLRNYNAKGMLSEAIALLDFSHGEETKGCPQRICAVQDLAACYGIKDGPGFAEERISVCEETLAQIDGSWPCYECVSGELIDALMDAEKFDAAGDAIERTNLELGRHNSDASSELILAKTRYYLEVGELDKAWVFIKDAHNPGGGDGFEREKIFVKTLTLIARGEWEAAFELAPSYEEALIASSYFEDWVDIQFEFVGQGLIENSYALRAQIHNLAEKLVAKDAMRVAFEIYSKLIHLCAATGEGYRANVALDRMRALKSGFHRDLGASKELEALREEVGNIPVPKSDYDFSNAEELLEFEFPTEAARLQAVENAMEKWPDDIRLLIAKTDIMEACFQYDEAFQVLEAAYDENPMSSRLEERFGSAYLRRHGFDQYAKKFPIDNPDDLTKAIIWNRGFQHIVHHEKSDLQKALKILKIIEKHWPEDVWLMGRIARMHVRLKDFAPAMNYRRQQIAAEPDQPNHKWDLLIVATLNNDTSTVCEMGEALGIELTKQGRYPDDHRVHIRLQIPTSDDAEAFVGARRLGPALAMITFVSNMEDDEQLYGREVVFDPSPLNQLDQKDDEGYACDKEGYYNYLYPAPLHTLHDPEYRTYALDGLNPGDEALERLEKTITEAGFVYRRRSGDRYKLSWGQGDEERLDNGVYIYILVKDTEEKRLNTLLLDFNKTLEHPLIWPELAEFLRDEDLLKQQAGISDKYNI